CWSRSCPDRYRRRSRQTRAPRTGRSRAGEAAGRTCLFDSSSATTVPFPGWFGKCNGRSGNGVDGQAAGGCARALRVPGRMDVSFETLTALPETELSLRRQAPIAPYTTFGIGGPADVLVEVYTEKALQKVVREAIANGMRWLLIGGGSNLLV